MDEFKITDSLEEGGGNNRKGPDFSNPYVYWGIIVGAAFIAGLSVFLATNAIFGPKKAKDEEVSTKTDLKVDSDAVQELYSYVTFGTNGVRTDKFISNKSVTLEDFSDEEKFYYALQFVSSTDFKDLGTTNSEGKKVYSLSSDLIKKYMKKYFGEKVTFKNIESIDYTFSFQLDGNNTGKLTYDNAKAAYTISFTSNNNTNSDLIKSSYGEVSKACSDSSNNTVVLEESIMFATGENVEGSTTIFDVSFYRDFDKTKLIGTKTGLTKEILDESPIEVSKYKQSNTITYTFTKKYDGTYYFTSSKMKY